MLLEQGLDASIEGRLMESATGAGAPARCAEVSEHCYLNEIPAFAESELARLYGYIHSSLAFFRTFRPRDGVNTYVTWRDGVPVTLLVFRCDGRRVDVYNEMCFIPGADIGRFARYVFSHFDRVHIISFKGVLTDPSHLPFPTLRYTTRRKTGRSNCRPHPRNIRPIWARRRARTSSVTGAAWSAIIHHSSSSSIPREKSTNSRCATSSP